MTKKKKAIIFGTGSFAEVAHYFLTHDSEYEVIAFTISKKEIQHSKFLDLPLIAFEDIDKKFSPKDFEMYIAIGYSRMNEIREKFYFEAKNKGYTLLSYISSKSNIFTNIIGDNCFILEDNTIQPYVNIGNNVVLWSGNHIGHHSKIASHIWISSHVVVSGHCIIKDNCFIGVNATLRDSITLEKKTLIGAAALVMKNTKEKEVYVSERTKLFKKNSDDLGF